MWLLKLHIYSVIALLSEDSPLFWPITDVPFLDQALVVLLHGEVVLVRDARGDDVADVVELVGRRKVPVRLLCVLNFAKEGVGSVRGAVDGGAAEVGAIDCVELLV